MRRLILIALLALIGSKGFAAEPPRPIPGVRYLVLIRHGDYDRDDRVDDRVGNGLNARGREQAQLVGQRLAGLPVKLTSLVSSDYTRARETAEIMGRLLGMTPARDSLLRECTPAGDRPPTMGGAPPGEEPACDSTLAVAWARYARPSPGADAHDVLVCHGNVTRWFACRALGADTRRWRAMDIGNASITVIAVRADSTTRLVMFSDVGHLPVDRQTWTGRGAGWGKQPAR
jgi:serine/threonine-protein phosphatase PGAM5